MGEYEENNMFEERNVFDRTNFDICGKMTDRTDFTTRLCLDIERTTYSVNSVLGIENSPNTREEILEMLDNVQKIKFKYTINPQCFVISYKLFKAPEIYDEIMTSVVNELFDDKSMKVPDIVRYIRLWNNLVLI